MILDHVKLDRAVVFTKYIASVVSLVFLQKTLIWNKIVLPVSNSMKVIELLENKLEITCSEGIQQYCFCMRFLEV